jgi:hypothetical protein
MKTRARILVVGLALCGAGLCLAAAPFDGKSYEIKLVEVGSGKEQTDRLIFEGGTFDSVECRQYGFAKVPYEASQDDEDDEVWTFHAEARSEKEGLARWKGVVSGDRLKGTMEWIKDGQEPIRYEFRGSVKR